MRRTSVLFLAAIVLAGQSHAATLRGTTTLQQPQVRICDLFDEAGPGGERVLGPGPAPGGRIVVESAQAAAIARQFGIAWRPASNAERVIIDRPGRLMARDEFMTILHVALQGAGAPEGGDIEIPGFTAPLVPLEAFPQSAIEQIDYDASSGRFTATLAVTSTGEPIQRMRLSGRVQEMVDVVVPTHRLAVGTVIQASDLQVARLRAGQWRGEVAHAVAEVVGKAVRRLSVQGQPLLLADVGRPFIVQKGSRVMMRLDTTGLSMSAAGQATEAGALGDLISVLNPASGAMLEAEITGPDQVRVQPFTAARLPARSPNTQVSAR